MLQNPICFIKAGKAIFTVKNPQTGNHFTFRSKKLENQDVWFISVLTGPNNNEHYTYMGTLFGDTFRSTKNSKIGNDAPSFKAFSWIWAHLVRNTLPRPVELYHESRCGRCGRRLTTPDSIETGFGPECIHHVLGN